jgi:Ca2+/Na+ antiporter
MKNLFGISSGISLMVKAIGNSLGDIEIAITWVVGITA